VLTVGNLIADMTNVFQKLIFHCLVLQGDQDVGEIGECFNPLICMRNQDADRRRMERVGEIHDLGVLTRKGDAGNDVDLMCG